MDLLIQYTLFLDSLNNNFLMLQFNRDQTDVGD